MYHYLLGISFLQQFRPYFRKYISNQLEPHEYFLLNTIIILVIIIIYTIYLKINNKISFYKMSNNYNNLKYQEIICIIILAILTVISGLFIFELDKNYNTPLLNSMYLKAFSTVALIIIGIFIFEESYKLHQFIGLLFIFLGVYLTSV